MARNRLTAFYVLEPGAIAHDVLSERALPRCAWGGAAAVPKRFLPIDTVPRHRHRENPTARPARPMRSASAMPCRPDAAATQTTPDRL